MVTTTNKHKTKQNWHNGCLAHAGIGVFSSDVADRRQPSQYEAYILREGYIHRTSDISLLAATPLVLLACTSIDFKNETSGGPFIVCWGCRLQNLQYLVGRCFFFNASSKRHSCFAFGYICGGTYVSRSGGEHHTVVEFWNREHAVPQESTTTTAASGSSTVIKTSQPTVVFNKYNRGGHWVSLQWDRCMTFQVGNISS